MNESPELLNTPYFLERQIVPLFFAEVDCSCEHQLHRGMLAIVFEFGFATTVTVVNKSKTVYLPPKTIRGLFNKYRDYWPQYKFIKEQELVGSYIEQTSGCP